MLRNRIATLFYVATITALSPGAMAQATWFVDVTGTAPGNGTANDPFTTIQAAVDAANQFGQDTILVEPGFYAERISVAKDVIMRSQQGAATTIIDGGQGGTVMSFDDSVSIFDGFTVQNGSTAGAGGGLIATETTLRIENSVFRQNTARDGGGLAWFGPSAALICDTAIENNQSIETGGLTGNGGGIWGDAGSSIAITDGVVQSNTTNGNGGGVYSEGDFSMSGTLVANNVGSTGSAAPSTGGGCYLGGQATISSCQISQNEVFGQFTRGGGLAFYAQGLIEDCTIAGNAAGDSNGVGPFGSGGGLDGGDRVEDTLFQGNVANGDGGGANTGAEFVRCTFQGNGAATGGGIYASFNATFSECRITQNGGFGTASADFGGGIFGPGTLTDCEIDNNTTFGEGAGAMGATLVRCLIRDNRLFASVVDARGGGALNCTLIDCVVRDNLADATGNYYGTDALGGGIFGGSATGCIIRGNSALSSIATEGGGAILSDLTRCAVYDNSAFVGAGTSLCSIEQCTIFANNGEGVRSASSLHNSIVRGNSIQLVLSSPTYCNIEGGFFGTGNINSPELFVMSTPGPDGARDLHFSSPLSPGVDAGDTASPLDPDGSRADMGAFPYDANYCPTPAVYCTAKVSSLGCVAAIDSSGTPTLSGPDDFRVTASEVLGNKAGLMFWGFGPATISFLGGTLCVQPPLRRTQIQFSGGGSDTCLGSFDFLFTQFEMVDDGLSAGVSVYAQYWYRDPDDAIGSSLSNALYWTTCN